MTDRLRRVPLSRVSWHDYDVVKSLFHQGFETLERFGGAAHPFIIAKLGSVVGARDLPGIYFYGRQREKMFETQRRIHRTARFVTLLSPPARDLWVETHGPREGLLMVPGAAERQLPPPGQDPYPPKKGIRCVFSGNFYQSQVEANRSLVQKLNTLGRHLSGHGRVFVVGPGDASDLDPRYVTYLGAVHYEKSWDYLRFADVGVVVSAGPFMHNNESTKIYHYLRAGLPMVTESGFPNEHVAVESGLAEVVRAGAIGEMAAQVRRLAAEPRDRDRAVSYILGRHTWEHRVETYGEVLRRHFPAPTGRDATAAGYSPPAGS
jgi:hypothetical protein